MEQLDVSLASVRETHVVAELLNQGSRWLHERGIEQWPVEFTQEAIAELVGRESTWLARSGDQAVATVTVTWADERFWGTQPSIAAYVHRLAVARDLAGAGIGGRVLDWAGSHSRRHGRQWLRLDCGRGNTGLRRYYEDLGFRHVRDVDLRHTGGTWAASLYQRRSAGDHSSAI